MRKKQSYFIETYLPYVAFLSILWALGSVFLWEYFLVFYLCIVVSDYGYNLRYRWINVLVFQFIVGEQLCFFLMFFLLLGTSEKRIKFKGKHQGQHAGSSIWLDLAIWSGLGWFEAVVDPNSPDPCDSSPCCTYSAPIDYDIVRMYEQKAELARIAQCALVFIVLIAGGLTPLKEFSVFWMAFVFLGLFVTSRLSVAPRHHMMPRRGPPGSAAGGFPQGIAKIYLRTPVGFSDLLIGHGYVREGVLHTRGHITEGCSVWFAKDGHDLEENQCCYWDRNTDVATYGGAPRFVAVKGGDSLRILLGTFINRYIVMDTVASVQKDGRVTFRMGLSSPGTSGSPVFVKREDGYYLAALTGRWTSIGSASEQCESFMRTIATDVKWHLESGQIIDVAMHPGAGKTRNCVPEFLKSSEVQNMPIVFAAPTRVVAEELEQSLERLGERPFLDVAGKNRTNGGYFGQRVVVTTHHTLLRKSMAMRKGYVARAKCVVLDESHFSNLSTMALVKLCRYKAEQKMISFVQMSATMRALGGGEPELIFKFGSNWNIEDIQVPNVIESFKTWIRTDHELKHLVFVPDRTTMQSLGAGVRSSREDLKVFELRRDTFDTVYPRIRQMQYEEPERQYVVIATNIAETGFNCPLDCVWDTQTRLLPVVRSSDSGILEVRMSIRQITQDQLIQRRGRVGRSKEGYYYHAYSYGISPTIGDEMDVDRMDLALISRSLDWATKPLVENEDYFQRFLPDVNISPQVIGLWMEQIRGGLGETTLLGFYLTHDRDGTIIPVNHLRSRIDTVWKCPPGVFGLELSFVPVGMRERKGIHVRWYDERDKEFYRGLLQLYFELDAPIPIAYVRHW